MLDSEVERLREVLFELRGELDRSQKAASEAEALVSMAEALTDAADRSTAHSYLVQQTKKLIEAPLVALVEGTEPSYRVDASAVDIGTDLRIPLNITGKTRNILDLKNLPTKASEFSTSLAGYRSFLSVPLEVDGQQKAALLCAHPEPKFFTKSHLALLKRISQFASHALTSFALSNRAQLLSAVIDGSSSSFSIADARASNRPLIFVNQAFEQLTGFTSSEVVGNNCRFLSAEPEDSEVRAQLRQAVANNEPGRFLLRNKKKSGEPFWNELTLFPVYDAKGETEYLVATQIDATDRVAAQKEVDRVKEQELAAQLAAGIAHDFNNLLSAINGSALLICTTPDVSTEIETHAARIAQAGNRAAKLVSRLLDLGSEADDYHVFDLKLPVLEAVDLARSTIGNSVKINVALDHGDCFVRGSTTQINQITVNLLLNARDAIGENVGNIDLQIGQERQLPDITDHGKLDPTRPYARLRVKDDGPGMNETTLGQVFEPYFSTKGRQGKGLGLAMVTKLVSQLGGAVKVESTLGEGATFTIWLPIVERPEDSIANVEVLQGKTILIVDDEAEAGEVLASYLARLGAEPSVLTMPELALEVLEEDHTEWDAVITDYDMPAISGGELAQKVKSFAPELPLFVVTALARRISDKRVQGSNVKGVFGKPLDLEAFAQTLASSLEKAERKSS